MIIYYYLKVALSLFFRQVVMELLSQQPPGSFMVRDSSSNPGCHALSVKSPDGQIIHYLLVRDAHGYFIQVNSLIRDFQ